MDATVSWWLRLPPGIRWTALSIFVYLLTFGLAPGGWIQVPITLAFLFICPGLLLIDWLNLSDRIVRITMVASSSLAVNILVATALAGIGSLTPESGAFATGCTSLALTYVSYSKHVSKKRLIEFPVPIQ